MQYSFNYSDIKQQVLDFMRSLNVQPRDERDIIIDGYLHRYSTHDDKSYNQSGAFCIFTDGIPAGWVQDWRKGEAVNWHYDMSALDNEQRTYFNSDEFKQKAERERKEAEEKRKDRQAKAISLARQSWHDLKPAPDNHPYLISKKVKNYGLHYNDATGALVVPLRDISGQIQSLQWIMPDGQKRFFEGAPTEGAFFAVALDLVDDKYTGAVLLAEGYATAAKLYELTGLPSVAAINCHALMEIARLLKEKYPKCVILVMADDDKQTEIEHGFNPGLRDAQKVVSRKLAKAVISPPFASPDEGTDWDDYAIKHGDPKTAGILQQKINWELMTEEQKALYTLQQRLRALNIKLDKKAKVPEEDFIAGLFPRGRITAVVAPPGTGKTWFLIRVVVDLSVGGAVFEGFATEDRPIVSVVFAGEAGSGLMIKRAADTDWPVNSDNVNIYSMIRAESEGISLMLDEEEGRKNIECIIELYHPDIIFFDTLGSFHNSDENKADEMKPILRWLLKVAERYNIAVVLMHHSRKMQGKEIGRQLTQDDVIGSSIFNRLVASIICLQPMEDEESDTKTLMVKSLKSWFREFMPFTYRLTEGKDGRTTMIIDLAPASVRGVNQTKFELMTHIQQTYSPNEWFKASDLHQVVKELMTLRQLQRYLNSFVSNKKMKRRGFSKNVEYSLIGFYDLE